MGEIRPALVERDDLRAPERPHSARPTAKLVEQPLFFEKTIKRTLELKSPEPVAPNLLGQFLTKHVFIEALLECLEILPETLRIMRGELCEPLGDVLRHDPSVQWIEPIVGIAQWMDISHFSRDADRRYPQTQHVFRSV